MGVLFMDKFEDLLVAKKPTQKNKRGKVGNCSKCIFKNCVHICKNYMICVDENGRGVFWQVQGGTTCGAILSLNRAVQRGVNIPELCRRKIELAYQPEYE